MMIGTHSLMAPLFLSGCCITGIFSESDSADTSYLDTESDADADGDADGDTDADSDADGDYTFEPDDPLLDAELGGASWTTDEGYWFQSGNTGYVVGTKSGGSTRLDLEIDGNIAYQGTYDVDRVMYAETEAHSYVRYQGDGGGVTFTVLGHDVDQEHVWGQLNGSIEMAEDTSGELISLDDAVLTSWPTF